MFARFDENPAMTLRVIKETKRYGRTDARTDGRTDRQRENSIPPRNKVCGGYNKYGSYWPLVKSAYQYPKKKFFLISEPKHMLWVSDFIWDLGKLPFPTHLGKYFIKIG